MRKGTEISIEKLQNESGSRFRSETDDSNDVKKELVMVVSLF